MAGEPSFIELGVPDADRAGRFYSGLFGWPMESMAGGGMAHTGTMDIGIHGGDRSALLEVFFSVDDLEASMARVTELGGTVAGQVNDSGEFGRWVECDDDQGVRFGLRQPR